MKNTVIEKDGYKYKWSVRGLNEAACINDIESNNRTSLPDHVAVMFADRYGCVAEMSQVRLMTHNQYQEYLKNNASRIYNEKGYSLQDYERDAAAVEIIGFDLSKFNLSWSDNVIKTVNNFFDSETVNKNGNYLLKGHVYDDNLIFSLAEKLGCEKVCDNYYNGFFKNDQNKCVLDFCEGDIYLTLCDTKEAYRAEITSVNEFYKIEDVCIEVYFDGVHMDNVFVSKDAIDTTINSIARNGFDGYNGAVKEDWLKQSSGNEAPKLTFKVIGAFEKSFDETLAEAVAASEKIGQGTDKMFDKDIGFDKE